MENLWEICIKPIHCLIHIFHRSLLHILHFILSLYIFLNKILLFVYSTHEAYWHPWTWTNAQSFISSAKIRYTLIYELINMNWERKIPPPAWLRLLGYWSGHYSFPVPELVRLNLTRFLNSGIKCQLFMLRTRKARPGRILLRFLHISTLHKSNVPARFDLR